MDEFLYVGLKADNNLVLVFDQDFNEVARFVAKNEPLSMTKLDGVVVVGQKQNSFMTI
jgi:hypothetical protein